MGCDRNGEIETLPVADLNGPGPDPALEFDPHPLALDLEHREGGAHEQAAEKDPLRLGPQVLLHPHGASGLTDSLFNGNRPKEQDNPDRGDWEPDGEGALELHG